MEKILYYLLVGGWPIESAVRRCVLLTRPSEVDLSSGSHPGDRKLLSQTSRELELAGLHDAD